LHGLKPPSRGKVKIGNEINNLKVFSKNTIFFNPYIGVLVKIRKKSPKEHSYRPR
jgi:hypothetical protein